MTITPHHDPVGTGAAPVSATLDPVHAFFAKHMVFLPNGARPYDTTVIPAMMLGSGLMLSVQASKYHYCSPREDDGPWSAVEVYVCQGDTPPVLAEHRSTPSDEPFGWVPIDVLNQIIADNGGIVETV